MTIKKSPRYETIALVRSDAPIITDVQSALDLMMSVRYETDCEAIVIEKAAFPETFFDLKSGLAGGILQKFAQYRMRVAIAGDFSGYASTALQDFIRESNKGRHVKFLADVESCENALGGR